VEGQSWQQQAEELQQLIQKALESSDFMRALELNGDLISLAERTGQIDQATSRRLRMDLVTSMIQAAQHEPIRGKVTLSLPQDILKALRIAAAESNEEMSEIVAEALKEKLKGYDHASHALRKTK